MLARSGIRRTSSEWVRSITIPSACKSRSQSGSRIAPLSSSNRRAAYSSLASGSSPVEIAKRLSLLRHIAQQKLPSEGQTPSHRIACFVRSVRKHRNVTFLAISDGSLLSGEQQTLQAVLRGSLKEQYDNHLASGIALELVVEAAKSKGQGQDVELLVKEMQVTGETDAATYPIRLEPVSKGNSKSQEQQNINEAHTIERLRRNAHLRSRDLRHSAILRTRDVMEGGVTDYFRSQDFVRVVTPVLTASDCEGGGEVFRVEAATNWPSKVQPKDGKQHSFWSDSQAYLTVSAQLHLEAITMGLGRAYTLSPAFRAEGSATNRHLAEFWMLEGEQITSQDASVAMGEVTDVVEGVVRNAILAVIERKELLHQLSSDKQAFEEIAQYATGKRWQRITYTDAIEQLSWQESPSHNSPPKWGDSLSSEQERWLARNGPIFVTNYPSADKPFYMLVNDDQKTVACFDLLVPRMGELVGGSLRETRLNTIQERIKTISQQDQEGISDKLAWYTDDLRKYGCNPHGGFGLGVERLLAWITDTDSVRDVITFPRVKGPLHF
ncbi:asparaginyl-tRNA synthetase [Meira miltonrushii]|uniref:asparagine--tRNA ligase n=1 Tax=Meira miltonrushii TaxID=1280837 RepID=A0A316VEB5_9BASI|nr:asparaginyl-tRNA synthetase [Meira miltonrushii]PWN35959.1 asparaginyl-tRNA synthetase [Meira miltonrushii]